MNARTMNQVKRQSNKYYYKTREDGKYQRNCIQRINKEKELRRKRRYEEEKRQDLIHAA